MGVETVERRGINSVADDECVEIDVTLDSGATETLMAESTLNGIVDISEGPAFRRGERKFVGFMENGIAKAIAAQICAVNQILMSVSKITSCGNRVFSDDAGSYIEENSTGHKILLAQEGGMYSLDMSISRKSAAEAGFWRPG